MSGLSPGLGDFSGSSGSEFRIPSEKTRFRVKGLGFGTTVN